MIKLTKPYLFTLTLLVSPISTHADQLSANPGNYRSVIDQLKPGSVLHLEPGTYTDGLPVIDLHGEPDLPIEITGPSQGEPAIFVAINNGCCNTVQIQDSSYIAINNLRIDGNGHGWRSGDSLEPGAGCQ